MSQETFRPAFTDEPGAVIAGIPVRDLELRLPVPDISYGLPYTQAAAEHVRSTLNSKRVYIIASGTLSRETDRVDKLVDAINAESGIEVVGVKKGLTPHTPWSEILQITKDCREANADCVVTVGAGSITDGAKLVVLALANDISTPEELSRYSVESKDPPKNVKEPVVPLVTIPTSLSGGEYFSLAGGTDDSTNHKQGFMHSGMGSKLVILDPELCLTTPEFHWLSTGVRSVDHCVEALCSLEGTPKSDAKAAEGLRLLVPSLLKCKADPNDINARHQCQMAVVLAMESVRCGIPMGGSHAIGHQLGPLGVPHGVTSCVLNPAVMKYNIKHGDERVAKRQEKVVQILWSEPVVAEMLTRSGLKEQTASLGDIMDAVIRALGMPRSLKEVNVDPKLIPALSERSLVDFWSPTNPVPLLKAEQVREILESAA